MKVYATKKVNGKVRLDVFKSVSEFEKSESWIDDKWIFICTSKDFKESMFSEPHFNEYGIVYNADQLKAYNLMHIAQQDYMKFKKSS